MPILQKEIGQKYSLVEEPKDLNRRHGFRNMHLRTYIVHLITQQLLARRGNALASWGAFTEKPIFSIYSHPPQHKAFLLYTAFVYTVFPLRIPTQSSISCYCMKTVKLSQFSEYPHHLMTIPEVNKAWPSFQIQPAIYFCRYNFIGKQPRPFIYDCLQRLFL